MRTALLSAILTLVAAAATPVASAQPPKTQEKPAMSKLHNTVRINASPDAVWKVLGDLAATHQWIPGIASARVEGSERVCVTADGFEIHETISDYDPRARAFSYRQKRVPIPVQNSRGRFAVEADGTGAVVVWEAEFEVLDAAKSAEVTTMVDGYYKQTLASLQKKIESGQ
jgi:carbon monoxide dehydrogenase subunit G